MRTTLVSARGEFKCGIGLLLARETRRLPLTRPDSELTRCKAEYFTARWMKPDELWDWFLDMYDLALRTEAHQELIHQEFLAAVVSKCRPDGRLELATSLRYVEAKAN